MHVEHTYVQFEFVFLLSDSLEQNYSKKKKNTELINKREPKTFEKR